MKQIIGLFILSFLAGSLFAQKEEEKGFDFKPVHTIKVTSVKDQNRAGTCWAYATTSFLEAELLRMGKGEFDFSEQYFVRKTYENKALKYFRVHGLGNFSQGGQAHDVTDVIRTSGMLPEADYSGLHYGENNHVHGEMEAILAGVVDAVIKNKNRKVTPVWKEAYAGVLDVYLGKVPEKIDYKNKNVTPVEFTNELGINADDYIEFTSYETYPFNEKVLLEIPDNWSDDLYYNVNLKDLMAIMNNALENGFTICWDGDVSEKGFSHKNNVAILPQTKIADLSNSERTRWEGVSDSDRMKQMYSFEQPVPEVEVTDELRQFTFDNWKTTDDHLMHLTGTAKDKNGTTYYLTKNSWAADSNDMGGNLYMSEAYVKMKTVAIMVHKDAVPKAIAKKLGLK